MTQEFIKHKKLRFYQWWIIFIILNIAIVSFIELFEIVSKYEVDRIIDFFVVLSIFIIIFLYWQMHYYHYEIVEGYLIIKEILGKKEKYTLMIPFEHILSIEKQDKNIKYSYHKIKSCVKYWMKGYSIYFIEYDDYMDISLVKLQCSSEFIQSLNKHISF